MSIQIHAHNNYVGTLKFVPNIQPSTMICVNQDMAYSMSVEDKRQSTTVATKGPISKRGPSSMELEITSESLKRRREYLMKVAVATTFETSNRSYDVSESTCMCVYAKVCMFSKWKWDCMCVHT